jgi:hypothetical protein
LDLGDGVLDSDGCNLIPSSEKERRDESRHHRMIFYDGRMNG